MYLGCFIGYFRVPSSVYVVLSKAQHTWTGARDEGLTAFTLMKIQNDGWSWRRVPRRCIISASPELARIASRRRGLIIHAVMSTCDFVGGFEIRA